jgi:hypothetical protein
MVGTTSNLELEDFVAHYGPEYAEALVSRIADLGAVRRIESQDRRWPKLTR